MAHTEGPWQVMPAHRAVHEWIIADKDGGSVADCSPAGPWMALTEADANARLIAAAPELLSALKAIIEALDRSSGKERTMRGELSCVGGRLMRHDPQPDDPYLQTDRGICPDCGGVGCEPPKAESVIRMPDDLPGNTRLLLVSCSKRLTDAELRDFQEYVREWEQ